MIHITLVGNPNCGKTTLFNALTGDNQRVGNWSGVTVDKKTGQFVVHDQLIEVTDLPGVYSLAVSSEASSQDALIAAAAVAQWALLARPAAVLYTRAEANGVLSAYVEARGLGVQGRQAPQTRWCLDVDRFPSGRAADRVDARPGL